MCIIKRLYEVGYVGDWGSNGNGVDVHHVLSKLDAIYHRK